MNSSNFLTIDVEDYFQVSAFEKIVKKSDWDGYPSRVVENTRRILSILESFNIRATFFVLGWTAAKHPKLVREISAKGHEIACHSYYHRLVYNLTPNEFREDTFKAKDTLEQITGKKVTGYRAPSYSITSKSLWAVPILHELGFTYDSSVFPIYHDRYGMPDAPRYPFVWDISEANPRISQPFEEGDNLDVSCALVEFPISTSTILGKKIPVSGGGYFRLFPYWFTKLALKRINLRENRNFVFYLHPWEFDPEQPRFDDACLLSKFRHYINLDKTHNRFTRLLQDFSFSSLGEQRNHSFHEIYPN